MHHFSVLCGAASSRTRIREKGARNYYDMKKAVALLNATPPARVWASAKKNKERKSSVGEILTDIN